MRNANVNDVYGAKRTNSYCFIMRRFNILLLIAAVILCIGGSPYVTALATGDTAGQTQEADDEEEDTAEDGTTSAAEGIIYIGVTTGRVNVRTGPGEEYDKLKVDDENFQLKPDTEVQIIDEEEAKSGIIWYKLNLEIDGKSYQGYSTSSYITKTDKTITPSPTPTPKATATPTPKATATPTPKATATPKTTATPTPTPEQKDGNLVYLIVAVAIIFVILVTLILILRKVRKGKHPIDGLEREDGLEEGYEDEKAGKRRRPEIKRLEEEPPVVELKKQEVYLAKDIDFDDNPYDQGDDYSMSPDAVKEAASREAEEKRMLRAEIERLQEHDIVIHKYFGQGEVYDNSDVNLLEVRFDNDVRFLNKDALVSKRLLEIYDDEQQMALRRKSASLRKGKNNKKKI